MWVCVGVDEGQAVEVGVSEWVNVGVVLHVEEKVNMFVWEKELDGDGD